MLYKKEITKDMLIYLKESSLMEAVISIMNSFGKVLLQHHSEAESFQRRDLTFIKQ